MPVHFKIVIDCADPHRLAAFWAEAMGYKVEDHSAFIAGLLAQGIITEDLLTEVDGHHAWKTLAAVRNPDDPFDAASDAGQGMRLLFQQVPEPKTVKNRLHLDLHVGLANIDAETERLEALGGTRASERRQEGPSQWIVMQDPEGNEFCVHS
ncbi:MULTISPECIES: VOC family protein [Glycomyces]|uniref:Enzyme related to lactoylglutathione lyase n=2 Tax=Glycomyces TaxID=58113 RepID=A0A9X3PLQ6_9ACTN|nr:VOC family protein [Glycomyces lechevalierae]MDA1385237.1 VOC family protein [Glycomyces lechevalierae]MDR7337147.1 putative enzyme related to lactoylglutathione lyase [Glycomyces lechevalierae]